MAFTSFFTSAILIALLVLLRQVEIKRGGRYLPLFREKLDRGAVAMSFYFIKVFPGQIVKIFRYVIIHVTDLSSSALLRVVKFIERKLHRFVHVVKGKKQVEKKEPPSDYFKDVQNHKQEVSKTIEELEESAPTNH